jgi:hypothetical protein
MNLRQLDAAREDVPGLLSREPCRPDAASVPWSHLLVDAVQQLETLADLYRSGLLSRAEFEQHKRHIRTP